MSGHRLTVGTFGGINCCDTSRGCTVARARYRDWGGQTRLVEAGGDTPKAAERNLKAKLAARNLFQPASVQITPDSSFAALVANWLEDLDLEDRLAKSTRQLYERNMRILVLPVFAHLALPGFSGRDASHWIRLTASTWCLKLP